MDADAAEVWAAVNAVYAGFLAGDRAAIDANISPDATVWDSGYEPLLRGKADLDAVRDARRADDPKPTELEAIHPVIDVFCDLALVRHVLLVRLPGGSERIRNTSVWRRRPTATGAASTITRTSSASVQCVFDYAARQQRLSVRLEAEGVDALFLAPSADLEYLTGVERQLPIFGEVNYAHGWVTGALFRPRREPVFLFPRMFAAFDLREEPQGEVIIVKETDDGAAIFERVAKQVGGTGGVAVGDRVWAETTLHLGRALGFGRLRAGTRIVNELRRTKDSDELAAMGRAIATVEQAMTVVAPLVVRGVSMLELAEAVEHELLAAGSRTPSFPTHIFTGLDADSFDSDAEGGATRFRRAPR